MTAREKDWADQAAGTVPALVMYDLPIGHAKKRLANMLRAAYRRGAKEERERLADELHTEALVQVQRKYPGSGNFAAGLDWASSFVRSKP